jgi:hypothetical protein
VSVFFGLLPLPSVNVMYCRPLLVVMTPSFVAFSARKAFPISSAGDGINEGVVYAKALQVEQA